MTVNLNCDWRSEDDDDFEDDEQDELEDDEEDDLGIEVGFGHDGDRLEYVVTRGLWWYGRPELLATPPRAFTPGPGFDWARLSFVLAAALISLGQELIALDDAELPPYRTEFDGDQVELWLGRSQPSSDLPALALNPEVDTVIRVECSVWTDRRGGDG